MKKKRHIFFSSRQKLKYFYFWSKCFKLRAMGGYHLHSNDFLMQKVSLFIAVFLFISWISLSGNPYGDPLDKTQKKTKQSNKSKEVVLTDANGNPLIMRNSDSHINQDYYIISNKPTVNRVYEIHIYNIDGKKVAIYNAAGVNLKMIETTTFQKGLYLYHIIRDGKKVASGKLIV